MSYEPFPGMPYNYDPINVNWKDRRPMDCECPACKLLGYESKGSLPDALAKHAREARQIFEAYRNAGFSGEEAMRLIVELMKGI